MANLNEIWNLKLRANHRGQNYGLRRKAVAIIAIAFFIFSGITMPASFATMPQVIQNEQAHFVPVVSYDPAAVDSLAASSGEAIPSGAAVQNTNPLSPSTASTHTDALPAASDTSLASFSSVDYESEISGIHNLIAITSGPADSVSGALASLVRTGNSAYQINYAMSGASSWVAGYSSFDDLGTPEVAETQDFSASAYFGLWIATTNGTAQLTVQFLDVAGKRGTILLDGVNTTGKLYKVSMATLKQMMPQVNFSKVKDICVVAEGRKVSALSGALQVRMFTTNLEDMPRVITWSPAASNANYAFGTETYVGADHKNYVRLMIKDFRTGITRELKPPHFALFEENDSYTLMDVSPQGDLVCFGGKNSYASPAVEWFVVRRMDTEQETGLSAIPDRVVFLENGNVEMMDLQKSFSNGTELGTVYTVDHQTLMGYTAPLRMITQGNAVLKAGYLIIPEYNSYSNHFTVTVYDASHGADYLASTNVMIEYHASQAAGGSSGSGRYAKIDAYKTSTDRAIITVGISAVGNGDVDLSQSFVFDPATGEQLTLNGSVTAVEYLADNIAKYTVTHRNAATETVFVDLATLKITQPPVPEGWVRVPSLSNRAYQREGDLVRVMDLLTGTVSNKPTSQNTENTPELYRYGFQYAMTPEGLKEIYWIRDDDLSLGVYDPVSMTWFADYPVNGFVPNPSLVSSDGKYLAVLHNSDRDITVVSLYGSPSAHTVVLPPLIAAAYPTVHFINSRQLHVTYHDGSDRLFLVTIQPDGSLKMTPIVPEGWTRAASNENYAFKMTYHEEPQPSLPGRGVLQVMDLRNGQITTVSLYGNDHLQIWNHYDISSDDVPGGAVLFYEIAMPVSGGSNAAIGYDNIVVAQRLNNPDQYGFMSQRVMQPGSTLHSIEFDSQGRASVKISNSFDDGTTMEYVYLLNLSSLKVEEALTKLIKQGSRFAIDAASGFAVYLMPKGEGNRSVLYDVSQGTDQMRAEAWFEFNSSREMHRISFVDINQMSDDPRVETLTISLSLTGNDGSIEDTVVGNIMSLPSIVFDSWEIESLRHSGNVIVYQFKNALGETKWTAVEIPSFQEVPLPVPVGWTRAASHSSYAYQVKKNVPDSIHDQLWVKDLGTGGERLVEQIFTYRNGDRFTENIDVHPEGRVVAYEVRSTIAGQKMLKIASLQSGYVSGVILHERANILSIEFSGNIVRVSVTADAGKAAGVYEFDIATGSTLFLPNVPAGWTRAVSNVNYAFKVEGMALKLKDLMTGTEIIVASGHTGGYPAYVDSVYDVSPDGTTVIYGINHSTIYGTYTYLQRISDPSQKRVVNGNLNSIRFEENGKVAVVNVQRSSVADVRIDVATLQYHVPQSWTRAASNANFGYKFQYDGLGGKLWVMNLSTGQATEITSVYGGGAYPVRFQAVVDISPDGTTVIYGTTQPVYGTKILVQRIASPSQKLTLQGILVGVSFNGNIVELTKMGGTKQWVDIGSLKIAPRPIPAGWKAVPFMPNMAYQTITGNSVRVMDLMTGVISEKPSSQNSSNFLTKRQGLYYVMISTGLKEIYSIKIGQRSYLQSYDPRTKKWTSYKA